MFKVELGPASPAQILDSPLDAEACVFVQWPWKLSISFYLQGFVRFRRL